MAIKHADTKNPGERGYASEWNKDHVVDGNVDFNQHELVDAVLENVAAFPGGPVEGRAVYRTDLNIAYVFNGTDWEPVSPSRRFATLVVAASNSLDKYRADYVCDGTDDNVEIQNAINALPAGGGRVLLLEGTYNFYNDHDVDHINIAQSGTTIEGQGAGTVLNMVGIPWENVVFDVQGKIRCKICNLRIEQPIDEDYWAVTGDGCNELVLELLWLTGDQSYIEIWNASNVVITNVILDTTYNEIYLHGCYRCVISDLVMSDVTSCYFYLSSTDHVHLSNVCGTVAVCEILADSDYNVVQGCTLKALKITNANCDENVLHGNFTDSAITDSGTNTHKADNWTF